MKKFFLPVIFLFSFYISANAQVVINEVYGGGNSGSTYTNDFIELYDNGATTQDLTGWSVQYASAEGTTWQVTILSGTIEPGSYYSYRKPWETAEQQRFQHLMLQGQLQ